MSTITHFLIVLLIFAIASPMRSTTAVRSLQTLMVATSITGLLLSPGCWPLLTILRLEYRQTLPQRFRSWMEMSALVLEALPPFSDIRHSLARSIHSASTRYGLRSRLGFPQFSTKGRTRA